MRSLNAIAYAAALSLVVAASNAQAVTINIVATQAGCGDGDNCFDAADHLTAGELVTLGSTPILHTFGPGTYTITNGDLSGSLSAWRYDGGPDWAWNFGIATYNGNNTGNLFAVGGSAGTSTSQSGMAQSLGMNVFGPTGPNSVVPTTGNFGPADYSATFVLNATTTLAFFVLDGLTGLYDNAGGVALTICPSVGSCDASAVPLPATLPILATGLGALGLLGWRSKRKRKLAA